MTVPACVPLADRGVLRVSGADARPFLQGLISNDVGRVAVDRAIWAAFLTPQGKYLHDFFVVEHQGSLLLEGEAARLADLKRRLSIYRLRSQVTLEEAADFGVWALIGDGAAAAVGLAGDQSGAAGALEEGVAFVDPRLAEVGLRAILHADTGAATLAGAGFTQTDRTTYDRLRIGLGLPDGSRDMLVEKSLLLECGFDELHGIDWQKGCWLGQELTARTRYRGLVKKRLLPVLTDGVPPATGTPVLLDASEVGETRSAADGVALAILRLEALPAIEAADGVDVAGCRLRPRRPSWAAF